MPLQTLSSYRNRTPGALPMAPAGYDGWDSDPAFDFDSDRPVATPFDADATPANNAPDPDADNGDQADPPRPGSDPSYGNLKDLPVAPDAGGVERGTDDNQQPHSASMTRADDSPMGPPPLPPAPANPAKASATGDETETVSAPPAPAGADDASPTAPPPAPDGVDMPQMPPRPTPPPAPQPKWYNRLAAAAMGGLGGYMGVRYPGRVDPKTVQSAEQNMLMPGYAQKRAAYDTQVADWEAQQNEQLNAQKIGAQAEERLAIAQQRKAQAASYAEAQANKANQIKLQQQKQIEDDAAKKDARDAAAFKAFVGKSEPIYRPANQPPPPGWEEVPLRNPEAPAGMKAYIPTRLATVPKELAPFLPGYQEGDTIARSDLADAMKAYRAELEKKDTAKPPAATETELAQVATDPKRSPDERAAANAALKRLDQSKQAARPIINNNVPGLGAGQNAAKLTGDAYLASLPKGTAGQVKAIAEGRATMPSGSSRSQAAQDLRNAVFTYDPDYSDQRAQIRRAFATGSDGRNIGALNTATVHLDQFADAARAMQNGTFRPGNQVYNSLRAAFGSSAPTNFESLKAAVAGEMASALKGNATDPEIANMARNIQAANSPQQLADAVETNLHVLGAKLNTYDERYHQQIPNDTVWSPVLPSARAVFDKHGIDPTQGPGRAAFSLGRLDPSTIRGGGRATNAASNPAPANGAPPAPAMPAKGAVQSFNGDVYRFDGTQWVKQPRGGRGGNQ